MLLAGDPGIGKSTLLLQLALNSDQKTLYVSGEESQNQIKMRARRVDKSSENCLILTETSTQNIFQQMKLNVNNFSKFFTAELLKKI